MGRGDGPLLFSRAGYLYILGVLYYGECVQPCQLAPLASFFYLILTYTQVLKYSYTMTSPPHAQVIKTHQDQDQSRPLRSDPMAAPAGGGVLPKFPAHHVQRGSATARMWEARREDGEEEEEGGGGGGGAEGLAARR